GQRGVRQAEQRVVLGYPLAAAAALEHLEAGRPAPGEEQQGQVAPLPAALEEGPRARAEQLGGVGHAGPPGLRPRLAGRLLLDLLVLLPQREEQLALAAEMVVEAAHAGPGPLDQVGDAGLVEPLLGEHRAGGIEQGPLSLRGAPPLPRPAR